MWRISNQPPAGITSEQLIANLKKAFLKKDAFFETSLETQVNSGPNGQNNIETDKKYIDLLTNAGFNVDITSLNYGVDPQRVNTLKTYRGNRLCLALDGPWLIGGNILSDVNNNSKIRSAIVATDGIETDGPMGLWYANLGNMRSGSYSLVQFAHNNNKLAAVMLAPYDAGVNGYQSNDFLQVAKQCVFSHEDHYATPDVWTIWTYVAKNAPMFPESRLDKLGRPEPAPTLTGVGYWLIKHLWNFPVATIDSAMLNSYPDVRLRFPDDSTLIAQFMPSAFNSDSTYSFPINISNASDPNIEISPIIQALISGEDQQNWNIHFHISGVDFSDDMIKNGGLNFINNLRITESNPIILWVNVKPNLTDFSKVKPVLITLKSYSNISNTAHYKTMFRIYLMKK